MGHEYDHLLKEVRKSCFVLFCHEGIIFISLFEKGMFVGQTHIIYLMVETLVEGTEILRF